jgi:hypothetical protein
MFIWERLFAREANGDHAMAFLKTPNTAEQDQNQTVETETEAEI